MALPKSCTINVSGAVMEVVPANGRDFKLQELYNAIDAEMVELVPLIGDYWMVVDEDGIAKSKIPNARATAMYLQSGGIAGNHILGTVLVCKRDLIK